MGRDRLVKPRVRGIPRRQVLGGIGAAAGLAACGPAAVAPKDKRRDDGTSSPIEPAEIETIVICMMENRSFDHVFGSLSLLEGRTDVDGIQPGWTNPDFDGNPIAVAPVAMQCAVDPPHGWDSSRVQFDGGTNQGFVRAFLASHPDADASTPMTFQTRETQPISYALADRYALCQRWFSSLLTSTWPNRLYFHCAQSQGMKTNDFPGGPYSARTIWDQLTDAGIDWAYYFTDLPTLGLFGRPNWSEHLLFIEEFYADAAAGALPSVVCVDAGAGFNDDHPPHHPMLGQLFIGSIYQALATSPHWDRCLFVLTYDEAGGFYDHVVPGTAADDRAADGFDQLGFRVPGLVAGPFVRNVVSDEMFEHSAPLTLIQDRFGIDERLTARNAASNDLGVLLDLDAMERAEAAEPIELPVIEKSEEEIEAECSSLGRRTGQPELRAFVQELFPTLDRTAELPQIARRAWRRAGEQGLLVPR